MRSLVPMTENPSSSLAMGVYTLPDAAKILNLPLAKLHRWVGGYAVHDSGSKRFPVGEFSVEERGRDRHFNFLSLIEVFTIAELRDQGVSPLTLRNCRTELSERFDTEYPFALQGLLVNGRKMVKEMGETVYLELGNNGQQAFEELISPFCKKIDFDMTTKLAERYFPQNNDKNVVVDPRHAFGRPVISGTNITTEALNSLARGGDRLEDIADDYGLTLDQVQSALRFENHQAA
jgi:uncharacterized protein (DUF433 family)